MNIRDPHFPLPDVQSEADQRELRIEAVGIKGVRYPVTIRSGAGQLATVGSFTMTVGLEAQVKGTHMSRFIELLEAHDQPLDQAGFQAMLDAMLERLGAASGAIDMQFPYFVRKSAPVSAVSSLLDHEVHWRAARSEDGRRSFSMRVTVAATSLCPCSKEISKYGAHNQRSHITIDAELAGEMAIEVLVGVAERSASCEVYGLLKRADEKYVTERAYENPKFVEDLVRDVALALEREPRVLGYTVEAENFESIHNHSAFARIVKAANTTPTGEETQ
jgi:GTP cyclohydrolase I